MIALARLCEDENVREVALRWNVLGRADRKNMSLTNLCREVGLGDSKFLGAVVAIAYELNIDVRGVVAAAANLDGLTTQVCFSAMRGGRRARWALLHSAGLLASSEPVAADRSREGLPSFEQDTIESTRFLRRRRK